MIVTPSLLLITSATTAPTWLFIRVTPHLFEGVLSDLNALSVVAYVVGGRLVAGHWVSSFGLFRLRSDRIPLKRLLARSRPSSNRGGLASGCDQIG